jgi:hypothetical protein
MSIDVCAVLVFEVAQGAQDGVGRGFPQATKAPAAHLVSEIFQFIEIRLPPPARTKPFQQIQHSAGANPTEGTLAAGLLLGELKKVARDVDHAGCVIENHQPTGPHDRTHIAK